MYDLLPRAMAVSLRNECRRTDLGSRLCAAEPGIAAKIHLLFSGPETFYIAATNAIDQPFYDVTKGTNGYFPATVGWDYASGLGRLISRAYIKPSC